MINKKINFPLTDEEKQTKPMPDEVSPEEAFAKARAFATQEKSKLKRKNSHQ